MLQVIVKLFSAKNFDSGVLKFVCFKGPEGADPGFFLGGGALVSYSTSTPINQIVFFFAEYQLY